MTLGALPVAQRCVLTHGVGEGGFRLVEDACCDSWPLAHHLATSLLLGDKGWPFCDSLDFPSFHMVQDSGLLSIPKVVGMKHHQVGK